MKDFANSRLKLKRTVIWAFCLYNFGWYLKQKSVFLKRRHCSLKGKVSSLSFPIRQCSIPDLSWITDAAIPLRIPAVKGNDHVIIVYFFNSARTPHSFRIDCFSFEAQSLWQRHHVFIHVRLAHAIKTGLRSIKPVNLFWWICNRLLGYLVVSSVPKSF